MKIAYAVWSAWPSGELEARVEAFAAALDAHRDTVDVPAPAEHPLVEEVARAGGMDRVTLLPPSDVPNSAEIPVEAMSALQLQALIARVAARLDQIAGA